MTTGNKYNKDKLFAKIEHEAVSGVVGKEEYECFGEVSLRVVTTFASSGTLTIQGRIFHSDTWEDVGTMQADGDTDTFDISTYDFIRFNFTTAAGSSGEVAVSGFFKGSTASATGGTGFTIIQPDSGTPPQAQTSETTLTLTSSDSSIAVEGDASTDTIDLRALAAGSANQIQYSDGTSLASSSAFTFNPTNNKLVLGTGGVNLGVNIQSDSSAYVDLGTLGKAKIYTQGTGDWIVLESAFTTKVITPTFDVAANNIRFGDIVLKDLASNTYNPSNSGNVTEILFGQSFNESLIINGRCRNDTQFIVNRTIAGSSNNLIDFTEVGTSRFTINGSGDVGIGTSTPGTILDINGDSVRIRTAKTPATASATGSEGEVAWDSDYIYVCVATNTWKRTALSTW